MDFLKKKMKELLDDGDKKPEKNPEDASKDSSHAAPDATRGASDSFYGQAPQGQGYPQQAYPQQQPYGQGPPPVGPPAPMGAPPPMPPGWVQQWDQNSQRWYYVEQATGRTQWDPPAHLPPGPYAPPPSGAPYQAPGGHDERALFGNTHGHQGHDSTPSGAATNEKEKKKDQGHSTAMLAAAGIGGVAAGAWIGHELTEDDNKSSSAGYAAAPAPAAAAAPAAYGAPPPGAADPYDQSAYPPPVPTHDADGSSISSSDRESLEEKRQEAIEAQQEYEEELQEAYDSD
ncbi:hypothetical protein BDU57DRAFT_549431 [Ampelomyces quisqualis]|uniref:WW domain-containing protein n=1 Tax=Ampelomyces quisqualis TaxID=50730 RepID=A0A6A5QJH2_AMPQU|nr:hypothetical protein BDU57DRAFT_549431 [Ampelomyces quisqualis]